MLAHVQCKGTTRAGVRCQMTAASTMNDSSGRSVAAPLRKGSPFCLFHAQPFSTKLATVEGPVVILYLDLETTGVAVSRARICELAAAHGPELAHIPGESFSKVVYVPDEIQQTPEAQAAARVHGISDDDISRGTSFVQSWSRFLAFTEACLDNMVHDGGDDSDDEPSFTRPPDERPTLVLVGHNSAAMVPKGLRALSPQFFKV